MEIFDLVIVGAGPAGIAASIYALERKLKTLVLEANEMGGQPMRIYPDKNIYDFPSCIEIKASELINQMINHAQVKGAKIIENKTVYQIDKNMSNFKLFLDQETILAKSVILATGMGHSVPKKLNLAKEFDYLNKYIFYQKLPANIVGKKIIIIGGGDTAIETALEAKEKGGLVTVIHRSEKFRALEETVDKAKKADIRFLLNSNVVKINGIDRMENIEISNINLTKTTIAVDYLIICIGMEIATDFLQKTHVIIDKQAVCVDNKMQTSIQGIFACGDVTVPLGGFKRLTIALGTAATAVNGLYQYLKNPYWINQKP